MFASFSFEICAIVALAAAIGGLTRGFTGFGFAMIFMPIASSVLSPKEALATIWVIDAPFALLLGWKAFRTADRRGVISLLAASSLVFPLGLALLVHVDPVVVRWLISLTIMALVAVLASGWRYHGKPGLPLTLGVGALSGLFGGMASLSGMPLALFWLSSQAKRPVDMRADMQSYFGLSTVVSGVILAWNGVLTVNTALLGLAMMPVYGAMLYAGTHGFRVASPVTFRRAAYSVILLAAVLSLPALDSLLR
ncbi:MAG: sulfite exporter TauE/SafE family protein [Beijerinckiaceae bacterium]|nr:sulfite exporter TauE/SafE family protein [Beijerinckiaceae bacterium]